MFSSRDLCLHIFQRAETIFGIAHRAMNLRVRGEGRDGAPRRPRRVPAAQLGACWTRWGAGTLPPAGTRAGTSQRDVPTTGSGVGGIARSFDNRANLDREVRRSRFAFADMVSHFRADSGSARCNAPTVKIIGYSRS